MIEPEIDDFDAAQIASAWHSVNTWNDPGVTMYSVTSTGKVHSEEHRTSLLAYTDRCILIAERINDPAGDKPVLEYDGDDDESFYRYSSCADELRAFRVWVECYEVTPAVTGAGKGTP